MKKLYSIGLTATGIMSIVFAIICLAALPGGIGSWVSYKTYGGDAYTGIQNATAQAANNIVLLCSELTEVIAKSMGFLLLVIGCSLLIVGITKLAGEFSKKTDEKATVKEKDETFDLDELEKILKN